MYLQIEFYLIVLCFEEDLLSRFKGVCTEMKIFNHYVIASALILCSALAGSALAEEIKTDEVTVKATTATRSTKDLLEVPMSVTVIDSEEIAKQGYRTVSDLLRSVPGIYIETNGDPTIDRIRFRGEHTDKNVILVNGQRMVNMDNGIDGMQFAIDPAIIERIEVIRGAASVLYGAEALAGVINIITKTGGVKPIQAEMRTSYTSYDDGLSSSLSVYGSKDGFNYRGTLSYNDHREYQSFHTELPKTSMENFSGNAYVSYDFSDKFTLAASYEYYTKDREYRNNLLSSNPDVASSWSDYNTTRQHYAIYADAKNLSKYLSKVHVDAYYEEYTTTRHSMDKYDNPTLDWYENPTHSFGLNVQTDWTIGDHTLIIAGYEFIYSSLDKKTYDYTTAYALDDIAYRKGNETTHAGFLSIEHYLPANFTINYGVRYTHYDSHMDKIETVNAAGNVISNGLVNGTDGGDDGFVFNAGIVWTGIENLALRASWAQGFKPATIYDRYVSSSGGYSWWSGYGYGNLANPNLEAETSNNFEIGARYDNGKFAADVALFYTIYDNYISSEQIPVVFPFGGSDWEDGYDSMNMNINDVKNRGVEVSMSYTFDSGFEPYFVGHYMKRTAEGQADNYGVPALNGKIGVRYFTSFRDNFFRYNADLNIQGQSEIRWDTDSYPDEPATGGYATVNLSFGVEIGHEQEFFAQVQLNNILDKRYQTRHYNNYYAAGFNGGITLGYRF